MMKQPEFRLFDPILAPCLREETGVVVGVSYCLRNWDYSYEIAYDGTDKTEWVADCLVTSPLTKTN